MNNAKINLTQLKQLKASLEGGIINLRELVAFLESIEKQFLEDTAKARKPRRNLKAEGMRECIEYIIKHN